MHVVRLSVTPVKGLRLNAPAAIDLHANGVEGDRRFYLIDSGGAMYNGKREGRLACVEASYDGAAERLTLRFPDGTQADGEWRAGEPVTTNFYGRPVRGRLAAGPWSAALSAYCGEALRLVAVDPPGDAVDVHPVTLITRASIDALRGAAPGAGVLDHRRFRMLVEIDGTPAFEEDRWAGRTLRIGSAEVQVIGPVPRCVVTAQNPDDGRADFPTLQTILAQRGARTAALTTPAAHLPDEGKALFGVYATVRRPGRIALGDTPVISAHA